MSGFNLLDPGLPWSTLSANVAGSCLIGSYASLTGPGARLPAGPRPRQFVMSGICGSFTTFSSLSPQTFRLAQAAHRQCTGLCVFVFGGSNGNARSDRP